MAGQNRKTFKYRIRRGNQNTADTSRIRSLNDLRQPTKGAAVGRVDESFVASMEDITKYREQMRRI